mmetsp:Transcript_16841/g.46433  ORF Transcript_16841/g.46433 Transcript_16841/m.46433 type:complete len:196 (-) Transcript_16841:257-844(-)
MEEKQLIVTMALSGAPVVADLSNVIDVKDVRARVANSCAVRFQQVELLQGGEKISDCAPLAREPISVVLGFFGEYRGSATYLMQVGGLLCESSLPFVFELTGQVMIINGSYGEIVPNGEGYSVKFPETVMIGEFGEACSHGTGSFNYLVTGCEFTFELDGLYVKAVKGKFHHPPREAPAPDDASYQGSFTGAPRS